MVLVVALVLVGVVVRYWLWRSGGSGGDDSLCKGCSCNSCRSATVKVVVVMVVLVVVVMLVVVMVVVVVVVVGYWWWCTGGGGGGDSL